MRSSRANCSGCHRSFGPGPWFCGSDAADTRARLVNVAAEKRPGTLRVKPTDPSGSDLWKRIEFDDMPRGGSPLTAAQKAAINFWITSGAGP